MLKIDKFGEGNQKTTNFHINSTQAKSEQFIMFDQKIFITDLTSFIFLLLLIHT